jgi:hypothetical protein
MLLANNLMLNPLLRTNIHHTLMIRRNSIASNNIILALSQTGRTSRSRAQTTRMLKLQILDQLSFGRFLQENLSEINNLLVMVSKHNLSSEVGLVNGEDGKRMRGSHDRQRVGEERGILRDRRLSEGKTPLLISDGTGSSGRVKKHAIPN